jgi:hypothetical protein
MIIFCASTAARVATVVQAAGYHGVTEAVTYGDIRLFVMRDPEIPGGVFLGMFIALRLLKGRRNKGNT